MKASGDEKNDSLLGASETLKSVGEYERLKVSTTSEYGYKQPDSAANMLIDYSGLHRHGRNMGSNRLATNTVG